MTERTIRKVGAGEAIRVGSLFGVSMPVEDTGITLHFEFWHERDSKNGTLTEIRKTAGLVDDFNQVEVAKRIENFQRIIKRVLSGEEGEDDDEDKPKGTAKERARKRRVQGG